jgi:hypothetical protein
MISSGPHMLYDRFKGLKFFKTNTVILLLNPDILVSNVIYGEVSCTAAGIQHTLLAIDLLFGRQ